MSQNRSLICLALTHTVVDTSALLIAPLWPSLVMHFGWTAGALSLALMVQALPTPISQAVFGYLRDRRTGVLWLWLGPILAAVLMPLIGWSPHVVVFFCLLIVGGIAIGAYHPEAAVAVGQLDPARRTRAISIFMFGGSLGLGLGPALSGWVVSTRGLHGLPVLILPLMTVALVLVWWGGLHRIKTEQKESAPRRSMHEMLDGRWTLAAGLLCVCALRLVPNMAMDKVLAFALEKRGFDTAAIGNVQSMFLCAASAGMFLMAFRFPQGYEKQILVYCPLIGAPFLVFLGWSACPTWLALPSLLILGAVMWGTSPAMVSYAQQLFPRGAGLASAMTMGVSWGIATLIQAPITAYFSRTIEVPEGALHAMIPCLLLSALGASRLPRTAATTVEEPAAEAKPANPVIETGRA